jgi:hypothetical protein
MSSFACGSGIPHSTIEIGLTGEHHIASSGDVGSRTIADGSDDVLRTEGCNLQVKLRVSPVRSELETYLPL